MGRAEYNPAINIAALPIQQGPLGCRVVFLSVPQLQHTRGNARFKNRTLADLMPTAHCRSIALARAHTQGTNQLHCCGRTVRFSCADNTLIYYPFYGGINALGGQPTDRPLTTNCTQWDTGGILIDVTTPLGLCRSSSQEEGIVMRVMPSHHCAC